MPKNTIERTTITVPKEIVDDLQQITQSASKTAAVVLAIHEEIKRRKLMRFRSLAGKLSLDKAILKGRHDDHRLR